MHYIPRVNIPDKLLSCGAAKAEFLPDVLRIQDKGENIRVENFYQPTREREHRMRGLESARQAQQFHARFVTISSLFEVDRHLLTVENCHELLCKRLTHWIEIVELRSILYA